MSRFLIDAHGTYDLSAVSAVTKGGTTTERGKPPVVNGVLQLVGGQVVPTETIYETCVNEWQTYLAPQTKETDPPTPVVTTASGTKIT
jgi:hypothetical protein